MTFALLAFFLMTCGQAEQAQNTSVEENKEDSLTKDNDAENNEQAVNYDCVHCGMPSQDYPKWHARITHETGESWTCSPRCMLMYTKNEKTAPQNIQKIEVIDYYDNDWIAAQEAFFVTGSDVPGPMGKDFVPCKSEAAAQEFKQDHQGNAIMKYEEIALEDIKKMLMKP